MVGEAVFYPPLPIGAPNADGYYVLEVLDGVASWDVASGGGGGGFIAGGDLSGTSYDQTVIGLQGRPIAAVAVATGQIYVFNGTEWIPQNAPSGSFSPGGDLSGSDSNQTVVGLQTVAISSAAPSNGEVLEFNGSEWAPTVLAPSSVQTDWTTLFQVLGG
jgi:hypothetical protein